VICGARLGPADKEVVDKYINGRTDIRTNEWNGRMRQDMKTDKDKQMYGRTDKQAGRQQGTGTPGLILSHDSKYRNLGVPSVVLLCLYRKILPTNSPTDGSEIRDKHQMCSVRKHEACFKCPP
jgi:hypothetical protein